MFCMQCYLRKVKLGVQIGVAVPALIALHLWLSETVQLLEFVNPPHLDRLLLLQPIIHYCVGLREKAHVSHLFLCCSCKGSKVFALVAGVFTVQFS